MEFDFSGYATRADTKCSDGRTIKPNAFKSDDGKQVPLCWQHGHSEVNNVLGHAVLENRVDGVYAWCKFNDTASGQQARELVRHKDVTSLSIYANNLVERGKDVVHGVIREVSLVLAGANPGALIDNVILAHDGMEDILDEEAVIYSGEEIEFVEHSEDDEADLAHYGVKGMKWGVRNEDDRAGSRPTKGEKAAAKGGRSAEKADKKWERSIQVRAAISMKDTIDLHNSVAKSMNGPNGVIAKLNNNPKYKDADFREDSPLRREYYAEFAKTADQLVQRAADQKFGTNASGSKKVEAWYEEDSLLPSYRIVDVEDVKHADEAFLEMNVVFKDGFIVKLDDLEMPVEHAATDTEERTFKEVYDEMDEEQQALVRYIISQLPGDPPDNEADKAEHGDNTGEVLGASETTNTTDNADEAEEGNTMSHNIFESTETKPAGAVLSHSDIKGIFEDFKKIGSLKDAVEKYALQHGIENIDLMFPDAQAVTNTPDFVKRQTEWVADVMNGTRHTPFSRIKSLTADLTVEEARAKGYIKGHMKKEEFFALAKRVTTPQTVYKKQKLDRDDIVDITDFDVVTWLKAEMRLMLNEEIARAILVGDGRSNADDDKIKEENIRPIMNDAELYVTKVYAKVTDDSAKDIVNSAVRYRRHYKGSGNPVFFTSEDVLASLLLEEDTIGRRLYNTVNDLQAALRVSKIVAVEVFDEYPNLLGIMVNLADYVVGSDKGGAVALFDDFDIDYNQFKYLIETRLSGALVKPKSAVVIMRAKPTDKLARPTEPAFNAATGVITIPTVTGVHYQTPLGTTVTTNQTVPAGESLTIYAVPADGYYFATNADDEWVYTRSA